MKEKLILEIINDLKEKLSSEQIDSLKAVLNRRLLNYKISSKQVENDEESKNYLFYLNLYLEERKSEGLSLETIKNYRLHLSLMLNKVHKNIEDINDNDLTEYLKEYKKLRNVSNGYLNDIRHLTLFSFGYK